MKEGDLTTEQQAEMIAEASGWRRRALVAEAALKVSRAETEKAAQFAIAATPPMRDREAIARLIARHSDVYEGMWPEHLGAADAILSLSPSPCDCLVREALEQIVAKDAEHEPDLGLLRHDFQTGFKGGVRWCAGIARTALQSHRGDESNG